MFRAEHCISFLLLDLGMCHGCFYVLSSVPCVRNYCVSYELLSVLRERNQLIILWKEEQPKTLVGVHVLKINISRGELAIAV